MSENEIESAGYYLIEGDVRDKEILCDKLTRLGIDGSLPTFILTECLLIYMKPEDT